MCGSPLTNPAGPHVEKAAPHVFIPLKGGKVGGKKTKSPDVECTCE